jgi:excisionase family DNA binding protein
LFYLHDVDGRIDARGFVAYHGTMTHDETNTPQIDPLTIGELISLQDAAEYAGLAKRSLHNYAQQGRLKAKKIGRMWVTTRAAVDEYLQSRNVENIPKKYRRST